MSCIKNIRRTDSEDFLSHFLWGIYILYAAFVLCLCVKYNVLMSPQEAFKAKQEKQKIFPSEIHHLEMAPL